MTQSFNRNVNTVYCDQDGVLADFDRFVLEKMGRTFSHMSGPGGDKEMWDFLATVDRMYFHLEPTGYAQQLWATIVQYSDHRAVLTAIPSRGKVPSAEQDKRDWFQKHRDIFNEDVNVLIGPFSRDKWKHAKPGDILIDDRADNIEEWITKGFGIGILHDHKDPQNTLNLLAKHTTKLATKE